MAKILIKAFGSRVLRVRLRRGAPDTAALLAHAAAASLTSHGLRVVVDNVEDDVADRVNPDWTDDPRVRTSVLLFAGNDATDSIRDRMVEMWAVAFDAGVEFLALVEEHASLN